MNLNLGKIIVWSLLVPIMAWAEVSAKLSQSIIYTGDEVRLTLTAEGDKVEFPSIHEIANVPILGTSNRESTTIINGKMTRTRSRVYSFMPTKDLVIPTYTIVVDGVKEMTPPLTLRVAKPSAASSTNDVQLEMSVDKTSAYVGEPITLNLTFKSLPNVRYDKIELSEPKFKKFWVKKVQGLKQGSEGNYATQTYTYVLFPQEEGNLTLEAPFAKLGKREAGYGAFSDPFFGNIGARMSWRKLFANELKLNIKPLPNNLEVYGDFSIKAHVDKEEVKANKPVNLSIEIKGEGNIEDIKKFDLDIDNAVVYSDEPKVYNSGMTRGVVSQKIAIVADRNFTIPAVSFTYFDKKTKTAKTIKTEPIEIKVIGSPTQAVTPNTIEQKVVSKSIEEPAASPAVTLPTQVEKSNLKDKLLWYVLGLISGILFTIFTWFMVQKFRLGYKKKEMPFIKKIKKAKTDKALFELLLPYRDEGSVIKEALAKLEKNIYASGSEKIDKEEIIEFFEEDYA